MTEWRPRRFQGETEGRCCAFCCAPRLGLIHSQPPGGILAVHDVPLAPDGERVGGQPGASGATGTNAHFYRAHHARLQSCTITPHNGDRQPEIKHL